MAVLKTNKNNGEIMWSWRTPTGRSCNITIRLSKAHSVSFSFLGKGKGKRKNIKVKVDRQKNRISYESSVGMFYDFDL